MLSLPWSQKNPRMGGRKIIVTPPASAAAGRAAAGTLWAWLTATGPAVLQVLAIQT